MEKLYFILFIVTHLLLFSCFDSNTENKKSDILDKGKKVESSIIKDTTLYLTPQSDDSIFFEVDSGDLYQIKILPDTGRILSAEYTLITPEDVFEKEEAIDTYFAEKPGKHILIPRLSYNDAKCNISIAKMTSMGTKMDGLWYLHKSEHTLNDDHAIENYATIEKSPEHFKIIGDLCIQYRLSEGYDSVNIDLTSDCIFDHDKLVYDNSSYSVNDSLLTFAYSYPDAKGYKTYKKYPQGIHSVDWETVYDTCKPEREFVGTWYLAEEKE